MLEPVSKVLGEFIASNLTEAFSGSEKDNLRSHIASVRKRTVEPSSVASSKKRRKAIEWAVDASDIDEKDNPELAAAWRTALAGIMEENEYKLLDIVKMLNSNDVKSIMVMRENEIDDYNIGDKLTNLGIAKREIFEDNKTTRAFLQVLATTSITAILYVSSELMLSVSLRPTEIEGHLLHVGAILSTFVLVGVFFKAIYSNIRHPYSYVLTHYGRKLADKMLEYLDDISQASTN